MWVWREKQCNSAGLVSTCSKEPCSQGLSCSYMLVVYCVSGSNVRFDPPSAR